MKKLMTNARTTEVDDTSDRLLVLYNDEPALAEEAFLKPLFGEMQTLSDQITEAIKRDRILSELEDADAEVETAVRALNAILKGYSVMPMPTYSEAGKVLYAVMRKYKLEILNMSYADQSSNTEAMLMDLSAPELEPHTVDLPGVSQAIGNVRAAQTNFTAKRVAWEKAVGVKSAGASASELRKPLLTLINAQLVPYLSAVKKGNPDTYAHFADAVAQVIENTNAVIRRRGSKTDEGETSSGDV